MLSSFSREIAGVSGLKPDLEGWRQSRYRFEADSTLGAVAGSVSQSRIAALSRIA